MGGSALGAPLSFITSSRATILACAVFSASLPASAERRLARQEGSEAAPALFIMPVSGAELSSTFGSREHPVLGVRRIHEGVDWAAPSGSPIVAVADGVVISTGWESGYGYTTRIRHAGTIDSLYAHQSQIAAWLEVGTLVEQGQVIGAVGATGLATGPHLHFEILVDDRPIDPLGTEVQGLSARIEVARLR